LVLLAVINFSFTSDVNANTPTPEPIGTGIVIIPEGAIRAGPAYNYRPVKLIYKGDQIIFYGVSEDDAWYLVDPAKKHWVPAVQIEVVRGSNLLSTTPTPENVTESNDVIVSTSSTSGFNLWNYIKNRTISFITWIGNLNNIPLESQSGFALSTIYTVFYVWGAIILFPLIRLKFRWMWGSLIFSLFLFPIGGILSIIIAIGTLFNANFIKNSSPKDMLEDIVGSPPISIMLIILFIFLTAISILGGVLFFAFLWLGYTILKLFLPGTPNHYPSYSYSQSTKQLSTSSSDYSSSSYDYDDRNSYSYDRDDDWNSNDNDDDDKDDDSSAWDGWLVKW